jgi:tRNA(Ile)-lysidine synthase
VLPLLDDVLAGGVVPALARTAEQLQDDLDALDSIAARLLDEAASPAGLALQPLVDQPVAIRNRVLKRWAESFGAAALSAEHVRQLDRLVTDWHGQDGVDLPGGYRAIRRSGTLRLVINPSGR